MDVNFIFAILNSAIRSTTPIMMAGLGSAIFTRSGVFNVALAGQLPRGSVPVISPDWFTCIITLDVFGCG